ncbi:collagen alpha-1(I) chain-like [Choloepus didactylus]|uniref:collagen alpha-1(I) chain-like n=1 Tax=Choloepus didactylus TaxID=27675 RepID=UPI00189D53C4|nr:collagen alpha-1(I) chain-like [Choloepus didactylus]
MCVVLAGQDSHVPPQAGPCLLADLPACSSRTARLPAEASAHLHLSSPRSLGPLQGSGSLSAAQKTGTTPPGAGGETEEQSSTALVSSHMGTALCVHHWGLPVSGWAPHANGYAGEALRGHVPHTPYPRAKTAGCGKGELTVAVPSLGPGLPEKTPPAVAAPAMPLLSCTQARNLPQSGAHRRPARPLQGAGPRVTWGGQGRGTATRGSKLRPGRAALGPPAPAHRRSPALSCPLAAAARTAAWPPLAVLRLRPGGPLGRGSCPPQAHRGPGASVSLAGKCAQERWPRRGGVRGRAGASADGLQCPASLPPPVAWPGAFPSDPRGPSPRRLQSGPGLGRVRSVGPGAGLSHAAPSPPGQSRGARHRARGPLLHAPRAHGVDPASRFFAQDPAVGAAAVPFVGVEIGATPGIHPPPTRSQTRPCLSSAPSGASRRRAGPASREVERIPGAGAQVPRPPPGTAPTPTGAPQPRGHDEASGRVDGSTPGPLRGGGREPAR